MKTLGDSLNKPKEVKAETLFVTKVRKCGGRALKLKGSGEPDRLVLLPHGCMAFVEAKRVKGETSTKQKKRLAEYTKLGYFCAVFKGSDNLDLLLEDIVNYHKELGIEHDTEVEYDGELSYYEY